jgi:hypothetical protein
MLADDSPVLADDDAIAVDLDLDGAPDRASHHRVFIVTPPTRSRQAHRGPRSSRAHLQLVHRRVRHASPEEAKALFETLQ